MQEARFLKMEPYIPEKPLGWHTDFVRKKQKHKKQPCSLEVRTEENNRFSYNDRWQERGQL